jgi:hypothetical protein
VIKSGDLGLLLKLYRSRYFNLVAGYSFSHLIVVVYPSLHRCNASELSNWIDDVALTSGPCYGRGDVLDVEDSSDTYPSTQLICSL